MKLALIPPIEHLDHQADCAFILAQHLTNEQYREFYSAYNGFKIIDHGEYEGHRLDMKDYFDIAVAIGANEIIVPDAICDAKQTFELINQFLPIIKNNPQYQYMFVPQGNTPREWLASALSIATMYMDNNISIGIPVWLNKLFRMRSAVVHALLHYPAFDWRVDLHLLGLDNFYELWEYPKGVIRSVDSSLPFSLGIAGINHPEWEYPPTHRRVSMNDVLDTGNIIIAKENIDRLRIITARV